MSSNHHTDSAIYQPILDVPVIPYSRRHRPQAISPQFEYFPLPESLDRVCKYEYRLEEAVIKAAEEGKRDAQLQEAATSERRIRVEAKRREAAAASREAEAEKMKSMAPGFSADGVLQPTAAQSPKLTGSDADNNEAAKIAGDQRAHRLHNYLEFEQGLAPPDPWDTPHTLDDDLKALGGVTQNQEGGKNTSRPTSPAKPDNSVMGFHIPLQPPSTYAYQPPDYVSQVPYHMAPTDYVSARVGNMNIRGSPGGYVRPGADGGDENVHGSTTSYSAPNQYASQPGPPRPPKNFDNYEPRPPTYHTPQPHLTYNPVDSPSRTQPGPPQEENPLHNLMNMGFSQQQAMDALQRNNYNMEGALNFLLDHSS